MIYYAKLERIGSKYISGEWSDGYLNGLSWAFSDSALDVQRLKEELLRSGSRGIGGNYVDIYFEGNKVLVGSQFDKEDDEPSIVSRDKFFQLIDEWHKIIKTKPDEIILYRDDVYNIWFEIVYFAEKIARDIDDECLQNVICSHYDMNQTIQQDLSNAYITKTDQFGCYILNWQDNGQSISRSMFPSDWSLKMIMKNVEGSQKNLIVKREILLPNRLYRLIGKTSEGMIIVSHLCYHYRPIEVDGIGGKQLIAIKTTLFHPKID